MSDEDRARWDRRYAAGEYATRLHPTGLLADRLDRLPRGRAADVACGAGRNAIFLAANGYRVDGLDVSAKALERAAARAQTEGVSVNWTRHDLDAGTLPGGGYDLIVVARFLDRKLFPGLIDALNDGGHLVYETHLVTSGEVSGPRSDRFRVRPQELLHLAHELRLVYYFEGLVDDPDGSRMALAQLIACKGTGGF